MSEPYKIMCGCVCCIYEKSMNSSLLTWRYSHPKHLKYLIKNTQKIRYVERGSRIFETYKKSLRTFGCHIHNTAADMEMNKMCPCPYEHHVLPQYKYMLRCCDKFQSMVIPSQ